ncbi:MAG: FAD-binding protein [Methylococcales bacterium]|jgi:D-lactate dehydrogenase (quinone)|nr:FAD-binding protein [Methylococcales bacterium]
MPTNPNLPNTFIKDLQRFVTDDQLLLEPEDCWSYGYDNSKRHELPDAIVLCHHSDEAKAIVQYCFKHQIPIVPRGRGTGTTGAAVPIKKGIVLSLEQMNKKIIINSADRYAIVDPGVTNQELQIEAQKHGFFWPPDPTSSAYCTVGGNLAYNSAGPRAVKYGTPRENTLGVRAIIGTGEEIQTGVYTTKGVVGYDLTRLLIGSEGTLGIITEATLKLTPLAEAKCTIQALYTDIDGAAKAISSIMAQPIIPCALELIDRPALQCIQQYSGINFNDNIAAMLMIEVDGSQNHLIETANQLLKSAENDSCDSIIIADTQEKIDQLWNTRKALSPALRNIAPKKINEDVVVPVSKIPDLIKGLEQLSTKYQIKIVNFGHAGNGNIHVNLLVNPDDQAESKRSHDCLEDMFKLVLSLKGSLSGEHGVGMEKQPFVGWEIDPVSLRLMRNIKKQFDPKNILNPDKMFPLEESE